MPTHPLQLDARSFVNSYRNPMKCLRELRKTAKQINLPKDAPQFDDILRKLSRESLSVLCERTPDLPRIADLIWKLHSGIGDAPEPAKKGALRGPLAGTAKPRKRSRKP